MNARRRWLLAAMVLLSSAVNAQPFAFGVNSDDELDADSLLRVNLANGDVEIIGALPTFLEDVEGLALDADGNLFAVDNATKSLVLVNPQTGDASPVDSRQSNLGFRSTQALDFGMTFDCNGSLLLVAEQTESLYQVNTSSGQALVIGQSGGLGDAMTAIASFGDNVFALAAGSSGLYRVNSQAGTAELVMTLDGFEISDAGMAFDSLGYLWAVLGNSSLNNPFEPSTIVRININTGEVLEIARTRSGIESLAINGPGSCDFSGLPGPASIPLFSAVGVPSLSQWSLLLLAALLALVAIRRLPLR